VGAYRQGGPLHYRAQIFSQAATRHVTVPGPVLDFGCGSGNISAALVALGYQTSGCDLSREMLARAETTIGPGKADLAALDPGWTRLPYEDGRYRAVVASSVLEYVPDVGLVLSELARVVAPGGHLLVTVPNLRHPRRWLEAGMAVLLGRALPAGLVSGLPRVRAHVEYLRTSRNRFRTAGWEQRFAAVGFLPVETLPASGLLTLFVLRRR
jgi:SAM-dependent methyltransferase